MTDNVTIPVPEDAPQIVATDEVDLGDGPVHAQFVKLLSGFEGSDSRLYVGPAGGVRTATFVTAVGNIVSDMTSSPYADGDAIGTGLQTVWKNGLYQLDSATVGLISGAPLPPIGLLFTCSDVSTPFVPTDHAPVTWSFPSDLFLAISSQYSAAADFNVPAYGTSALKRASFPDGPIVGVSNGTNPLNASHESAVSLIPICEGGWSDDVTAGLLIAVTAHLVGETD